MDIIIAWQVILKYMNRILHIIIAPSATKSGYGHFFFCVCVWGEGIKTLPQKAWLLLRVFLKCFICKPFIIFRNYTDIILKML